MNSNETVIEILETMDELESGDKRMSTWCPVTKASFYGKYLEKLDDAHRDSLQEVAIEGSFALLFSCGDYLQDLMRANVERIVRNEHENLIERWVADNHPSTGLSDFDDATELDNADRARGM